MKYLFLLSVMLCLFGFTKEQRCRAYDNTNSWLISGRDTLEFYGENAFRIGVHAKGSDRELTGTYTITEGVMELSFEQPKGEEIRQRTFYTYKYRQLRYVAEGSTGFYGYKGQRFKRVYERPQRRR